MIRVIGFAGHQRVVGVAIGELVDGHVGTDADVLDRAAVRRVVVGGCQTQRRILGQRHGGLHRALAEGGLADNQCAMRILQRARHDLRRRCRVRVGQHDHRHGLEDRRLVLQRIAHEGRQAVVRIAVAIGLLRILDLTVGRHHHGIARQKCARHTDRALHEAATVVAQVEHEALQIRLLPGDFGELHREVGCRALLETRNAHVSVTGRRGRRFHALQIDDRAGNREREGAIFALAVKRERDLGARRAAHQCGGLVRRHAADRLVVDAGDQVARTNAGAKGGRVFDRRNDLDESVFRTAFNADAGKASGDLFLQVAVVALVEIRRVRVEARHHAFDRSGQELVVLDRFDVFLLDLPEHFGKESELIERQRRRWRLRGKRGQRQHRQRAECQIQGEDTGQFLHDGDSLCVMARHTLAHSFRFRNHDPGHGSRGTLLNMTAAPSFIASPS